MSTPLTDTDALILMAARSILSSQAVGYPSEYGAARVVTLAELAEQAIFQFLNSAAHHGNDDAAYAVMHPDRPTRKQVTA